MAENPYAGISQSFAQGMQQGQQWAEGMANMDIKMQTLAQQNAQLEFQRQQQNYEKGKYFVDSISKIIDEPSGKAKNLKIQYFRNAVQKMGYSDPEMLATMMEDPAQVTILKDTLRLLNDPNLPQDMREQILTQAADKLSSPEADEAIKKARDSYAEMLKIRAQGEQTRTTEVAKKTAEAPGKEFEATAKIRSELKPYNDALSTVREGYANLQKFQANPSGFNDIASLYTIVKIFDPNSVVREGEIELSQSAASLPASLLKKINRMTSPTTARLLTKQELDEVVSTAGNIYENKFKTYEKQSQAALKSAKKMGLDESEADPAFAWRDLDKKFIGDRSKRANVQENKKNPPPKNSPAETVKYYQQRSPELVKGLLKLKGLGKSREEIDKAYKSRGKVIPPDLFLGLEIK